MTDAHTTDTHPRITPTLAELTAEVAAAFVAHNACPVAELPSLLRAIHGALAGLSRPAAASAPTKPLVPAVPVKQSVTEDYIVCLDDGRKLKSLKRHLAHLGMTPAAYRVKWGLPPDYPIVAPAYAKVRSNLARSIGLGQKRRAA